MAGSLDNGEQSKVQNNHSDSSTVLREHMYEFAFEKSDMPVVQTAIQDSARSGNERNRDVLTSMQTQSMAVRDLFQIRSLSLAEGAQNEVIRLSDSLDLKSLSDGAKKVLKQRGTVSDTAAQKSLDAAFAGFSLAAASPFIERARLGAIQLRQGREGAAEETFADALKQKVPDESLNVPSVRQLRQAVVDRHEELKVKRTLPEVFAANLDWIDSGQKDNRLSMQELNTAASSGKGSITSKTLVNYLMSNFENIDRGITGIDAEDIRRHWEESKTTDLNKF